MNDIIFLSVISVFALLFAIFYGVWDQKDRSNHNDP